MLDCDFSDDSEIGERCVIDAHGRLTFASRPSMEDRHASPPLSNEVALVDQMDRSHSDDQWPVNIWTLAYS